MGHSLQLTVVAEGVETAGQLQFLRDHGCDEVQGALHRRCDGPRRMLAFMSRQATAPA